MLSPHAKIAPQWYSLCTSKLDVCMYFEAHASHTWPPSLITLECPSSLGKVIWTFPEKYGVGS